MTKSKYGDVHNIKMNTAESKQCPCSQSYTVKLRK